MSVTQETKDELRRLHGEMVNLHAASMFTKDAEVGLAATSAANDFREAAACLAIFLLDALDAAEAERDRLPVGPLAEIAAERRRQVDVEGWSTEHDDQHRNGEMAAAAACYAAPTPVFHAVQRAGTGYEPYSSYEPLWPWNDAWWKPTKPTTPRRDLIKAGALIVAELERLDRAALGDAPCP